MRIIFMGTPEFAVPSLQALIEDGHEVAAVITQPDRPQGRKRLLTPSAVKREALLHQIPVLQPGKLRDPDSVKLIEEYHPDLIVTAAYGQILPKSVLIMPRFGCINVHGSLLPRYRGGAPIQRSIINGEKFTGVTIMFMAEGLDTGEIISQVKVEILEQDTAGSMFDKLSLAGAELLRSTLPEILAGNISPITQNSLEATYAPNLSREDERVVWTHTSEQIYNLVRGLNPWPGAYTLWNNEVLKIWSSSKVTTPSASPYTSPLSTAAWSASNKAVPGTVIEITREGIEVATGDGIIRLTEIQPSGKKAMNAEEFIRGRSISIGNIFI